MKLEIDDEIYKTAYEIAIEYLVLFSRSRGENYLDKYEYWYRYLLRKAYERDL